MKQLYELYLYPCDERHYTHPVAIVTIDTALEASIKELVSIEDAEECSTMASFCEDNSNNIKLLYEDSRGIVHFELYSIRPVDMRYLR